MAGRGRPTMAVVLTDDERETLERWARRPKSANALATRCGDLSGCAGGATNRQVAGRARRAREHGVEVAAAGSLDRRLDGLHDEPRPGAPRTISDDDVERVVVKTLGGAARRRHALVDPVDGQGDGDVSDGGGSKIERPSDSSRISLTASSCRPTRSSSTRYATSSGCT